MKFEIIVILAFAIPVQAQVLNSGAAYSSSASAETGSSRPSSAAEPLIKPAAPQQQAGVAWGSLLKQTLLFLSIENGFRCATEEGTRAAFSHPFFPGYLNAVGNLHGWDDGDPFYVNYIGHPMQGSVTEFMWTNNDSAYRDIQFGKNRKYWKGKFRAAAFSYVYSVLLEIGPISEASIGNIQAYYPEQGFVDHVVTPVIGMGWSVTEDTLDRYLIRRIEARTPNKFLRFAARTGLNPSRSVANVMGFQYPWHRGNRPGLEEFRPEDKTSASALELRNTTEPPVNPPAGVAPFEFAIAPQFRTYFGEGHHGSCVGAGGLAAIRLGPEEQFVVDVNGCKLFGLENNMSGDSLSYLAGPRWTFRTMSRWTPHAELLVGGNKLTQEFVNRPLEADLNLIAHLRGNPKPLHSAYSQHWETNGFAVQARGGVDVKLNAAISIHALNVGYSHSWVDNLNGINYRNALEVSSGVILRMGTW